MIYLSDERVETSPAVGATTPPSFYASSLPQRLVRDTMFVYAPFADKGRQSHPSFPLLCPMCYVVSIVFANRLYVRHNKHFPWLLTSDR